MATITTDTIYSVATDACERAARTGRDIAFRFNGTESRATPRSCIADVVEIWFLKRQFEGWKRALSRQCGKE